MSVDKTTEEFAYLDTSLPIIVRVKDLIGRMTLEEKVGLMNHPAPSPPPNGPGSTTMVTDARITSWVSPPQAGTPTTTAMMGTNPML